MKGMLSETPIRSKSSLPYLIFIFILLQVWAIIFYEVAQYQMVILYESPFSWLGWSSFILAVFIPILGVTLWRLKETSWIGPTDWNFRVREVEGGEFKTMMKEYRQKYSYLVSFVDYHTIFFTILIFIGILFIPFYLMRTNSTVISLTPSIIAILVILFGLGFSAAIFKMLPTSATSEFPIYNPRKYLKITQSFCLLPGIFWCGIRANIGESAGLYTVRDPTPVARIEGIESVGWLECKTDAKGNPLIYQAILASESDHEPIVINSIPSFLNSLEATELIKKTIELYIERHSESDVLQDIIEEIDIFIRNSTSSIDTKNGNGGLISSYEHRNSKEEAD